MMKKIKDITIILVDDDEVLLEMYKKKIGMSGFNILIAKNGKEGFKLMHNSNPNLMIIDLVMPSWDGFELYDRIRMENKVIPVVAFTNLSDTSDKQEALDKGFFDYWVKSDYTPAQIVSKIKKILN
jgi:two-component system, OmpR family, response regulator MprA